ncbi:MAG: hypothetical protein NT150_07340 [Bacteroidetes bacterium]|nr:hypothetical protein [Bacteroidota bacterium]
MRTPVLAFILFSFIATANAQVYKYVEKIPAFSLSVGSSYLVDSKDFGAFLKYYLPTNNGFSFYAQGVSLFPQSSSYREYRIETGMELVFFKVGGFSTHALFGVNYGYWQRENEFSLYFKRNVPKSDGGSHYHKDNSYFVGGGIDFEFNKNVSLYASWKGYPEIFVSYAEAGVRFNVYPSDKPKRRASRRLKSMIK